MFRSQFQIRAAVLLGITLLVPAATAAAPRVHGPAEVLERHCVRSDGRLYFTPPTGGRFELVTETSDPVIANPGDGAFHPMSVEEVRRALDEIRFDLSDLDFDVWVLPYPRREQLASAAGDGVIYLAPGTREWPIGAVHSIVSHEVGHVVHRAWLPFADRSGWEQYARLRGFLGDARYSTDGTHAYRPQEVFAEDFRALFGSDPARAGESLENAELSWPVGVPGLESFFLGLSRRAAVRSPLSAYPNPFREDVRLELDLSRWIGSAGGDLVSTGGSVHAAAALGTSARVAIFDARGRLVRSLPLRADGGGRALLSWDGRDEQARRLPRGVFYARIVAPGSGARSLPSLKLVLTR